MIPTKTTIKNDDNEMTVKLTTALTIIGMLFALLAYATDWQRKQDAEISKLDRLVEKQSTILEMQIKYNEQLERQKKLYRSNQKENNYFNFRSPYIYDRSND